MITIKTQEEVKVMAQGGRILAEVLTRLKNEVRPRITTIYLDELARKLIVEAGAKPAFLNYRPVGAKEAYPFTLCASINDCVVHGHPSDYELKDGDLLKLDLGVKYGGFYTDSAVTIGVGKISAEAKKLISVTEESLVIGIKECKVGKTTGDIGNAIQKYIEKNGFSVVRSLTGHGIGLNLHEDPEVLNFGRAGSGEVLEEGMVVAIEPIVAMGSGETKVLTDDSFVTKDGSLSAHFEHTVVIMEKGPEILTRLK